MDLAEFVLVIFTGLFSAFSTVVALKVDITWIKATLEKHDVRLRDLEGKKC